MKHEWHVNERSEDDHKTAQHMERINSPEFSTVLQEVAVEHLIQFHLCADINDGIEQLNTTRLGQDLLQTMRTSAVDAATKWQRTDRHVRDGRGDLINPDLDTVLLADLRRTASRSLGQIVDFVYMQDECDRDNDFHSPVFAMFGHTLRAYDERVLEIG